MVRTKVSSSGKKNASQEKIVVTSALPYANGSLHLGHMVEYIQTDIYVRALKLFGKHVLFCCADDTHGAPIELKAMQQKITPEELIAKYFEEHQKDFADFFIAFDSYYTTNSPENKELSDFIYQKLKEKGFIYKKKIPVIYCPQDKRFLPDRYVRGVCPHCKAEDQYGDVCEKCGKTHKTTELIHPRCSLCGAQPEERESEHLFFKLSAFAEELKTFLKTSDIQEEVRNFVLNWIGDLKDWCISRDGPYFGFPIPGEKNKFYYVWLDAPVGYIASTANYCKTHPGNGNVDDYWKSPSGKVIHVIGKDIMYFHLLFWPAMLMTAGFHLPSKIQVHGFLTVNKEKMSKSRGTFITAREYLEKYDPEHLRYYYASHLSTDLTDVDFDVKVFKEVVNHQLVANIGNFCYRTLSFLKKNFDGKIGAVHFSPSSHMIPETILSLSNTVKESYEKFDMKGAMRTVNSISSLGNKYFQEGEPWNVIKTNKNDAHQLLTNCVNIVKILSILIAPVLPKMSKRLQKQLNVKNLTWKDINFSLEDHTLGEPAILVQKIEEEVQLGAQESVKTISSAASSPVFPLELRVGTVLTVENHPNAEKLYVLSVDLGTEKRTIVSGLRDFFKSTELKGKNVVVVANLKPAKLRGVISNGMVLTAEKEKKLVLLNGGHAKPGSLAYVHTHGKQFKEIEYKEFAAVPMVIQGKNVLVNGSVLKTDAGAVTADIADGAKVC